MKSNDNSAPLEEYSNLQDLSNRLINLNFSENEYLYHLSRKYIEPDKNGKIFLIPGDSDFYIEDGEDLIDRNCFSLQLMVALLVYKYMMN